MSRYEFSAQEKSYCTIQMLEGYGYTQIRRKLRRKYGNNSPEYLLSLGSMMISALEGHVLTELKNVPPQINEKVKSEI